MNKVTSLKNRLVTFCWSNNWLINSDKGLSDELLENFKKNHVQLITASDAHKPADVGSYIKDAEERNKI